MRSSWAMIFLVVVLVAVAGYALYVDRHDKMAAQVLPRAATETSASSEGYRVEVCVEQTAGSTSDLMYTWISRKRTIGQVTRLRYVTNGEWCDIFFVPLENSPYNVRVAVKPKELIKSFSYRYRLVTADYETEWSEKTEVVRYGDGMYPLAIVQAQK